MKTFYPRSSEETECIGANFASSLGDSACIAFFGTLGSGKTTFIKGLASGLGIPSERITSPTFQYMQVHRGRADVIHFDLYRLTDYEEFLELGFDDFFFTKGIVCIEWAERIEKIAPENMIHVYCTHIPEGRKIEIHV